MINLSKSFYGRKSIFWLFIAGFWIGAAYAQERPTYQDLIAQATEIAHDFVEPYSQGPTPKIGIPQGDATYSGFGNSTGRIDIELHKIIQPDQPLIAEISFVVDFDGREISTRIYNIADENLGFINGELVGSGSDFSMGFDKAIFTFDVAGTLEVNGRSGQFSGSISGKFYGDVPAIIFGDMAGKLVFANGEIRVFNWRIALKMDSSESMLLSEIDRNPPQKTTASFH